MPPPDPRDPGHPHAWLRRARSNWARAKTGRAAPEVLLEDYCFDAQQAAEKAIKAVLVSRRVEFPKTHVISRLPDLAQQAGAAVPAAVREADVLTVYATHVRYPSGGEDVDDLEYQQAVAVAAQVVHWAEATVMGEPGG
jgi:HEPN domain-containing protein